MLILTAACRLASTARDTVVAFLAATLGTVIGTVAAWQAVGYLLGPDGWKVAAALCGSYVGGLSQLCSRICGAWPAARPPPGCSHVSRHGGHGEPFFPNLRAWNVLID